MRIKTITQPNVRNFSDWFRIGNHNVDYCCDCGLAHETQYKVLVNTKKKQVMIYLRLRRHINKTHLARKRKRLYK